LARAGAKDVGRGSRGRASIYCNITVYIVKAMTLAVKKEFLKAL